MRLASLNRMDLYLILKRKHGKRHYGERKDIQTLSAGLLKLLQKQKWLNLSQKRKKYFNFMVAYTSPTMSLEMVEAFFKNPNVGKDVFEDIAHHRFGVSYAHAVGLSKKNLIAKLELMVENERCYEIIAKNSS